MANNMKKVVSLAVIVGGAVAGAIWGYSRYRYSEVFISTENAYVKGHVTMVAAKIPGNLVAVEVAENQPVKAGQVIATIDPRDTEAAMARASASIGEASSALALNRAQIAQAKAGVEAAESQKALAEKERARLQALYDRQSIPRQKLDHANTAFEVATAQVEAARKQVAAAEGLLGVSRSKVDVATAALAQARLQRSYCTVVAPCDGVVSRKMAEPGMVIAAGQPLLAVVPLGQTELWVEANYKETQLRKVKPGQPVKLRADIDPGRVYTGTVESLAAGTGAVFSLLPAENATGNWVKVVQRVPVKIKLDKDTDPEQKLRLGLSMWAEIDTRDARH